MYRIAIASALLMITRYHLYFLYAELFQTDHYIILKQIKATCLSDVQIIGLKTFLCQLNWTMSMASFNIWCPRYFFCPVITKMDRMQSYQLILQTPAGDGLISKGAIARFVFFCKRREFRREIHTPPWVLIGRISFFSHVKKDRSLL